MQAKITSLVLHVLMIAVFLLASRTAQTVLRPADKVLRHPHIILHPVPSPDRGGGGNESTTPPSRGRLPRFAPRQFVPPQPQIVNFEPLLVREPSLVLARQADESSLQLAQYGDPLGAVGPPSLGSGRQGIGARGTGGYGEQNGIGGSGTLAHSNRGRISPPVAIYKTDPEFSEDARKAKLQGTVVLDVIVNATGTAENIRVRNGLGLGLDEKAIEAVLNWKFRPALQNGKPVAVPIIVYINFRLL